MKKPKNNINNGQANIIGYFDGPKLYKRQNNNTLLRQSLENNNRKSPNKTMGNEKIIEIKSIKAPLTTRNSYLSQKNKGFQQSDQFYTTRNKSKQRQLQYNIQEKSTLKRVIMLKKQFNPSQRKRFYYKQQYDSNDEEDFQHQQLSQKSQSKTILPNYFSKINTKSSRNQQIQKQTRSRNKQKRSLSPLEESQQILFAKCYKQTSNHLGLMLKQIHQSQNKLEYVHQEILNNVYDAVKQRSFHLKRQLIEMVEKILDDWENSEWQFIKKNQILFLDDLLELKEQLREKENKVNQLMERLQKQKSLSWVQDLGKRLSQQSSLRKQSVWKNVTTDLLMFNYEDSIIEIQQLSEKILSLVPQKCMKAISILPSFQLNKNSIIKAQKTSVFVDLKNSISQAIFQISQSNKLYPSNYIKQKSLADNYQLNKLSKINYIKNQRY